MWRSRSAGSDHALRGGQTARAARALQCLRAVLAAFLCGGSVLAVAQAIVVYADPEAIKAEEAARQAGLSQTQLDRLVAEGVEDSQRKRWAFLYGEPVTSLTGTSLVAGGDFNGDGKPDVVVAGFKLAVLLGQGNGSFGAERVLALPSGVSAITNLAVGDVNGDGRDDVVFVTAKGVFVAYADASGALQAAQLVDAAAAASPVAVADLYGDGRADIVVADDTARRSAPVRCASTKAAATAALPRRWC